MPRPARIPIFPLEVVLFPGALLPLHIFEPRYRRMVRDALAAPPGAGEFGIVLSRQEGAAAVGCTAEILEVTKRYDDGRMDILTQGRMPFRIGQLFRHAVPGEPGEPLYQAEVEYLPAATGSLPEAEAHRLEKLFQQCHSLVFGTDAPPLREGMALTFHVAAELPFDLEFKQELLEMEAEDERAEALAERLTQWLPQLRHLERVRRVAGGNGHPLLPS